LAEKASGKVARDLEVLGWVVYHLLTGAFAALLRASQEELAGREELAKAHHHRHPTHTRAR
jgi:hypothetical protein